ncbi:MAG TPA: TIGR01212 family radical SAM protein [Bacteroidales bacterium]|nr:TIGR01212 family radical SAM protein [Bacteroidales bacterium]
MKQTQFFGNRRYNNYNEYFKRVFGRRVQKLSVDAGFTCPNRDGKVGHGGCTYCNNDAFNPSYCVPTKGVSQQLMEGKVFHSWRYRRAVEYLAYFQAFSNTYAPLDQLKRLYTEALSMDGVIGLVIGTRPDCVDEEKLDFFASLAQKYYVILEYGIESCYNKTLDRINRGHSFETAQWAIKESAERGIHVGAHLIFGLPGESREEMLAEAEIVSSLPLDTIKFHQLQIIQGTLMQRDYELNPNEYDLFTPDEYYEFVVDFTERLNPEFVIERFSGEAPPRFVIAPQWGKIRADEVARAIEDRLAQRDTWQGRLFER